jgi:hypothetical protein
MKRWAAGALAAVLPGRLVALPSSIRVKSAIERVAPDISAFPWACAR